ncbi:Fasciclin-domain-containing protein [Basidiobolus meristosporus CBS 931.73]|uniref:Fasciclin-domain-containing protein n=1 Tax=Basidiobolus meristosporus CBS 931.73 TaxID=1314790 RepID=A0A1Y1YF08_9FUNG|nr:Fasciclin-domain-containing protein [Basidiobolus meristosporus CBS 931.73]|eukprot:ORX96621.1 Fasciclin-domain-containing protein [Basidiobolus meristosporus CBS 931.73]
MRFANIAAATLFLASGSLCQDVQKSLADNASSNQELGAFSTLVSNSDFESVRSLLSGTNQFTLFAPSDAALKAANIDTNNATAVLDVLKYHIISGKVKSTDLKPLQFPATVLNDTSVVNLPDNKTQVLGVSKNTQDVQVSFGLKSAKVIKADLESSNGVTHIIDQVLLPPISPSETAKAANLTTLVELLTKANITSTIDGFKGATIFAPSNEALRSFDTTKLNATALADLLKYHVITTTVGYSSELKDGLLATAQGSNVNIKNNNGVLTVNNAKVITPNVLTSNGVVHVVDSVLVPGQATSFSDKSQNSASAVQAFSWVSGLLVLSGMVLPQL